MILADNGVLNDSKLLLLDSTGNALTASKLQTPRTIGGVYFDGSANINLPGVNTVGNQNTTGHAASATTIICNDSQTIHIGDQSRQGGIKLYGPNAGYYNIHKFATHSGQPPLDISNATPVFTGGRIGFGVDTIDGADECGIGKSLAKDLYIWNISDTTDDIFIYCNGEITSNSHVGNVSDARLKHNIKTVSNALSDIRLLRLCSYYKTPNMYEIGHNFELNDSGIPITSNNVKYEIGFIAQEVQNIDRLKHAVRDNNKKTNVLTGDPHPLTLDYNALFCYSIAALQELDSHHTQTCEELKAAQLRIVSLETSLSALDARLSALEQKQ
jgi:hypothetical protein